MGKGVKQEGRQTLKDRDRKDERERERERERENVATFIHQLQLSHIDNESSRRLSHLTVYFSSMS